MKLAFVFLALLFVTTNTARADRVVRTLESYSLFQLDKPLPPGQVNSLYEANDQAKNTAHTNARRDLERSCGNGRIDIYSSEDKKIGESQPRLFPQDDMHLIVSAWCIEGR